MTGQSVPPIDSSFIETAIAAAPRLSLKPTTSGYVDGAWWPGSLDLATEIPALIGQLSDRWGTVDRVSYDLAAWAPTARRVVAGGTRIRLDGFRGRRPKDAVHVRGRGRAALTLLVIPPSTDPGAAEEILRCAGSIGNQQTIDDLLHRVRRSGRSEPDRPAGDIVAGVDAHARTDEDATDLGRWDAEGGHDRRLAG